jgi:diguanylate cyclase (GGDEF)-like protein
MELLVDVAGADTLEADAAIVFDPADGRFQHGVSSASLPPGLAGPTSREEGERASAWQVLLEPGAAFVTNVDELPPLLRRDATAAGYRSLWAAPGDLDRRGEPGVWAIAWRRELHLDADESRTTMMARLATLAGLALARSRNEERNVHAASHDPMTGLWNRNAIYAWLSEALSSTSLAGVGVIYVDLDRFKPINDSFGHAAGDRVLREVAQRLVEAAPADGRVGRFGGDEFVYVGPASTADDVDRLAAHFADAVAAPIELRSGEVVQVGASTGAAFAVPGITSADELVELADAALYRVKSARSARSER